MKAQIKFAFIIFLAAFLGTAAAYAGKGGGDVSGGGGGVRVGEKVYLYDLYEAGLQDQPYIENPIGDGELEKEFKKAVFPSDLSHQLLSRKIRDIEGVDPYLAAALVEGFKVLSWRVVDQQLERSPDFGDIKEVDVLQLASRRGGTVQIQRALWSKMDQANRVALVLHETLAALQPAKAQGNQGPLRRLVAYLFDQKYFDGLLSQGQIALEGFPSYFEVKKRIAAEQPELLEPFRHFTRFIPIERANGKPAVLLTGTYILSPYVNMVWTAASDQESQQSYLVPHYFELPFKQYCSLKKTGPQLLEMQIHYMRMKVSLTSYQTDGSTWPMLQWSVEERHLTTLVFDSRASTTKANCSPRTRNQWEMMKVWNAQVSGEGANAETL